MHYWDYENYEGSLEDKIEKLLSRGKNITSITVLKYAESVSLAKQKILFPVKAIIFYS